MRCRRVLCAVLLVSYLPACASYQQTGRPLAELTAPPEPVHQMRVTLANGSRMQVTSPRVDGDTLRGTEGLSRTSGPPVAIALSSITRVEVAPPSKKLSTGATIAIAAATVGVVALLVIGGQQLADGLDELGNMGN